MTISYTGIRNIPPVRPVYIAGDVANASSFGCFNKILLRWRGSVYKLIYKVGSISIFILDVSSLLQELLAYVMIYLIINIFYREFLVKKSECHECLNVTFYYLSIFSTKWIIVAGITRDF